MKTTTGRILFLLLIFPSINLFAQTATANPQKIVIVDGQRAIIKDGKFNVQIELTLLKADSTKGMISITKNGVRDKVLKPKRAKQFFNLDLNANYLIKCSQKGYTTKVVLIDTTIPNGREKEEFALFKIIIELHKKVKSEKIDSTKPVGGIKFSPDAQDFDFYRN